MDKFWEPIIIENDELKKLRLLVHRLRQDVVNCACDIVHSQSQAKFNKRNEKHLFDKLHEKLIQLDDTERALLVAETYNYELMEARQLAQIKAEEKKSEDELRKEQRDLSSKASLRAKKHRIQDWIDDRGSRYTSDIDLLKAILIELGTIRNWIIDPIEYDEIRKTEYK